VFEQYDQQVQTQTTLAFGDGDAAVIAPRGTAKGLSVKIDGNARYTYLHPYRGGKLAVVEAARNVACTGARPAAVTDGLNFGDPRQPHVYWQFEQAVRGIADAADAMGTPVISGNVSFYNESELGEVLPTPVIGTLGVMADASKRLSIAPPADCDLYLVSTPVTVEQGGLGASSFLAYVHGIEDGFPEDPDVAGEKQLCEFLCRAAEVGAINSAHDLSDGGLAVAAAEIALKAGGVELRLQADPSAGASALYGEVPGRVLIGSNSWSQLEPLAQEAGLSISKVGRTTHSASLSIALGDMELNWTASELGAAFEGAIPSIMATAH
jgi:phosphoribosylformylglycinamidine synthase